MGEKRCGLLLYKSAATILTQSIYLFFLLCLTGDVGVTVFRTIDYYHDYGHKKLKDLFQLFITQLHITDISAVQVYLHNWHGKHLVCSE